MTLISSLNIAQQAITANQAAITVISNNIANMDNSSYSRQGISLSEVINYTPASGNPISIANSLSGVEVTEIKRYSNSYLQKYFWQENTTNEYYKKYASMGASVQNYTNELNDTGLSDAISKFYDAVDSLNDSAEDYTARQTYVSAAQNLCTTFNTYSSSLTELRTSLVGNPTESGSLESSDMAGYTSEVNSLLDQLADINFNIIKTNSLNGTSSSSLLDQRDAIIDELSGYLPVTVAENSNGTMDVSISNTTLVKGNTVKGYLGLTSGDLDTPAIVNIVDPSNSSIKIKENINDSINNGSMGAILDMCGSDSTKYTISGVLDQIDNMAQGFADIMNEIQLSTTTGDGTTPMCLTSDGKALKVATEALFVSDTGTTTGITAGNITLNADIVSNPYEIAAARVTDTTKTSDISNSTNATAMVETRNTSYSGLGSSTIEGNLAKIAAEVGTYQSKVESSYKTQTSVLSSVSTQLAGETGVDLNEELVDLVKFQRAYQAASRIFSVCNDLLDDLMNLGK